MSKIKAVYNTMDEVPEQYIELYEERDGKAQLSKIEGLKTEADIERLSTALAKERNARKTAETSLSLFPGSPEEILEELDTLRGQGAQPTQAQLREVERLKAELSTTSQKALDLENMLGSHKLQSAFVKEATEQGVTGAALDDVLLWGEKLFTVKEGEVVSRDENNLQTPADWLSDLKSSGKKDYWFEQSSGSGATGAKGAGSVAGVEHFTKGTGNLTKMTQIYKTDPEKAERLAKLAGHTDFNSAVDSLI